MQLLFLDMRTIVFTMLINCLICTVIIISLWYRSRSRYEGTFYWVLDYTFQTVALLLIGLRGTIPDWLSIVAANIMAFTGALFGYIGMESFTNKRSSQVHNVALIFIFSLFHAYFTFIRPDLAVRNLNLSIFFLIISFQCFHLMIFRVNRSLKPVTRGVGMVFGLFCVLHLARIVNYFVHENLEQDFFRSGAFESLVLLSFQLVFIILAYSLVLMVNKRLLWDMEQQEEKFAKAFQSSPYGVIMTRLSDGAILEVNEGFEAITGYLSSEVEGRTSMELNIWDNEEDRSTLLKDLVQKGKIHEVELTLRRKTGERFTAILTAEVITINTERTILSTINDITRRKHAEEEREKLVVELREALSQIKTLSGLLPICASCKKIRNDMGRWEQIEVYIRDRSDADFSHGICPECEKRLYPDLYDKG